MNSFTDLQAWKIGLRLSKGVFVALEKCRFYSLADQLRRASTSILANMAEGFGRATCADKASRYVIARGECMEVIALLLVAAEVGILPKETVTILRNDAEEVGRMLNGLIRKYSIS